VSIRSTPSRWAAPTIAAAVVVAAAAAAWLGVVTARAAPTSAPSPSSTTQPSLTAGPRSRLTAAAAPPVIVSTTPLPMSAAFSAVRYRSIFVKGEQSLRPDGGGYTRPAYVPTPSRPQASLVFNGVIVVGDRADAMIEDTNAHRVFTVRVGELLAGGRVLAITFDNLDYQDGGKLTRVAIGQTLEGTAATSLPDAAPTATGGPPPPDAAGTLGNTVGMSPEDILARMKRRRQMEMGGK
jgi:hypothetical protein